MALKAFGKKYWDKIEDKYKLIVFGYIHEVQKLVDATQIIPNSVIYLCLSFYYIGAYFEVLGKKIKYQEGTDQKEIYKGYESYGFDISTAYAAPIMQSRDNNTICD